MTLEEGLLLKWFRKGFVKSYEKRLAMHWSKLAEEAARQRYKTDEITWKMEVLARAFREVKRRHLLKIMSEMNRISVHQYCWDHIETVQEAVVANEVEEFAEALHRQTWWVTDCTTVGHA